MKVCVVIVTYGNRFRFLKQVIDACLREGVEKIIVVDNASHPESKNKLKELESKLRDKIKVIYLDENTGSAGGYKRGLQEAYKCEKCEFIWLLDDDNEPQKGSLKVLKEFWKNYYLENKEENLCLLSYRSDRIAYKEAVVTNNPYLVLGKKNSFLGFHVVDLPKKVIRVIKRKLGLQTFKDNPNIKYGLVAVAPYGGMFFHKRLINKIGYPREKFFLYADDHEWSYRITKIGGRIVLLLDSVLEDIDKSWNIKKGKETIFDILHRGNSFRIYYSTRNRIAFEQENLVSNKSLYKLNLVIFKQLLSLYLKIKKNKNNIEIFNKAVNDGLNFKLGKLEKL